MAGRVFSREVSKIESNSGFQTAAAQIFLDFPGQVCYTVFTSLRGFFFCAITPAVFPNGQRGETAKEAVLSPKEEGGKQLILGGAEKCE